MFHLFCYEIKTPPAHPPKKTTSKKQNKQTTNKTKKTTTTTTIKTCACSVVSCAAKKINVTNCERCGIEKGIAYWLRIGASQLIGGALTSTVDLARCVWAISPSKDGVILKNRLFFADRLQGHNQAITVWDKPLSDWQHVKIVHKSVLGPAHEIDMNIRRKNIWVFFTRDRSGCFFGELQPPCTLEDKTR